MCLLDKGADVQRVVSRDSTAAGTSSQRVTTWCWWYLQFTFIDLHQRRRRRQCTTLSRHCRRPWPCTLRRARQTSFRARWRRSARLVIVRASAHFLVKPHNIHTICSYQQTQWNNKLEGSFGNCQKFRRKMAVSDFLNYKNYANFCNFAINCYTVWTCSCAFSICACIVVGFELTLSVDVDLTKVSFDFWVVTVRGTKHQRRHDRPRMPKTRKVLHVRRYV